MGNAAEPRPRPTFELEAAELQLHGGPVAGVDEAGRGPLAGPVVAAAVILDPERIPDGIDDSKVLDEEDARTPLRAHHGHGDRRRRHRRRGAHRPPTTSSHATMWAMAQAVAQLAHDARSWSLIDGNRAPKLDCPSRTIVKGDAKLPVDRRRLDHRQGDARPPDGQLGAEASRLRLRAPQGLRHAPSTMTPSAARRHGRITAARSAPCSSPSASSPRKRKWCRPGREHARPSAVSRASD